MTPQEELASYFEVCGYSPDDPISIVTRAQGDGPLFWSFTTVAEAPRQILARKGINCWFSANPMTQPADSDSRGTAADVVAVRALWADIDIKPGGMPDRASATAVMKEVSDLIGAKPVAIVASGHGFQPRWRLANPVAPVAAAPYLERFGRLVQLIAEKHGGKADMVYDLPRIIRAPHTTNIKPGLDPVPTKVWLYPDSGPVSMDQLIEVLDTYVPLQAPATPSPRPVENRNVGLERGNAYTESAVEAIRRELEASATWTTGQTDEKGRGWEKVQADAAFRLASLAKADWNDLTLEKAKEVFTGGAPVDDGWTMRDVIKKWKSQEKRAEPADPPSDSDDPLGGGATPHRPAADEAAIWGGSGGVAGGVPAEGAEGEAGPLAGPDPSSPPQWRKYTWDDRGNAERIEALFGSELRYAPLLKRWLRYEGGAWRETETGGEQAALQLFDRLYELEGGCYSDIQVRKGRKSSSPREDFAEWVGEQRSATRVQAAARMLKYSGDLDVVPSVFDAEPMLLNAPNGIIDLYSGELLEHDPSLMLRRQIPVEYHPKAKAPQWEAFLERVMPSPDMRDYLQRIIGYSITGETSEQVVFFHVGPPATGKSVFLRVIEAVLGDFSRVVPPTTLLNKKLEQHPTDVMGMEGRRMLQASETPEGARLDEALLKRLSGEETITARGMGENFRDFRIVGKVHLVTNHPPHLSDDQAVHRRLHIVPWSVQIPEDERDPLLAKKLIRCELPGILAWAVRGTRRWTEARLERPVEAQMAKSDYVTSEDEFGLFIQDELIVGAEAFTESKVVYRRYRQWAEGQGMKPMSSVAFGRKMSARGIEPTRTREARGFKCALQNTGSWSSPDPLGG